VFVYVCVCVCVCVLVYMIWEDSNVCNDMGITLYGVWERFMSL